MSTEADRSAFPIVMPEGYVSEGGLTKRELFALEFAKSLVILRGGRAIDSDEIVRHALRTAICAQSIEWAHSLIAALNREPQE